MHTVIHWESLAGAVVHRVHYRLVFGGERVEEGPELRGEALPHLDDGLPRVVRPRLHRQSVMPSWDLVEISPNFGVQSARPGAWQRRAARRETGRAGGHRQATLSTEFYERRPPDRTCRTPSPPTLLRFT